MNTKKHLFCKDCGIPIDYIEAFLTNSLNYSCGDCFEEWDMQEAYLTDNYFYETY